ncbi:uncharacterized protein A4U43_C09F10760 [Asparagus officinalis]|uniref:ARID domain-containing protein n=1 Tax=Asparagus officinalis TaxID=4686 RepID=A0A5P1E6N9_ASPOF|nr:uncharacterized protein A4U43_C09F10760 [Asparagus officinalis]
MGFPSFDGFDLLQAMGLKLSMKRELGGDEMNNGDSQNCYVMMNEPVDADKGKELMPAVEGSTMTEPSYQHKYPEPFAKYKDVVEDSKLFMDTLGKLHAAMGTKFMIPTIGGRELDLHQLFVEVTARGGIEKVIADRRWREVTAAFNFPSTATNASFVLRKYYMSLLHHYEKLYFFGSLGWSSPTTATSVPAERSAEAILQHSAKSISARKRRINGELTPPGPQRHS